MKPLFLLAFFEFMENIVLIFVIWSSIVEKEIEEVPVWQNLLM